jgi:hypothetical protein
MQPEKYLFKMDIVKSVKPYTPLFIDLKNNTCIRIYQTYPEVNADPLYIVNFYNEPVTVSTVDGKSIVLSKKTKAHIKPDKVVGFSNEQLQKLLGDFSKKKLL